MQQINMTVTNNGTKSEDFKTFRKLAFTNTQINAHLRKPLNSFVAVFKVFLTRAYKICSNRYIDEEIQFLIDVFTDNGCERKNFEKNIKKLFKRTAKSTRY